MSSSSSSSCSSITDEQLLAQASEYYENEINELYRQQVYPLIAAKDIKSLKSLFYPRISFGTAGLRARMGAGYKNMNELVIIQTTQGFIKYLEAQHGLDLLKKKGIILGYDGRYYSKTYCAIAAQLFLSLEIPVYTFRRLTATPFVPFGILQLGTLGGVMVTASHNPKDDNGYKVYWANGCQIIPPHDEGISKQIALNMKPWTDPNLLELNFDKFLKKYEKNSLLRFHEEELYQKYAELSKQYYHFRSHNEKNNLRVTYTAMHGVGAPFVERVFQSFSLPAYTPTPFQIHPDPEFRTVKFPNPEEGKGALALAIEAANAVNSPLILANDPDADRLAVAEKDVNNDGAWRALNGNEIALLLADWSFRNYKSSSPTPSASDISNCIMVASTVSSKVLGAMAKIEGFQFVDTLTGFKWIGNAASDAIKAGKHFLFAYEVEIGFLFGNISLDKDGIRTAAIFNELAASLYEQGTTCIQYLDTLYKKYGYFVMNTGYFYCEQPAAINDIFLRIRSMGKDGSYPFDIAGHKIKSIRDITKGYDSAQSDHKSLLPATPDSHMITFYFENGGTLTLRTSGTEPKLKYYIECSAKTFDEASTLTAKVGLEVLNELVEPNKHKIPQVWLIGPAVAK